jgi:hypothetical protein
LTALGFRIKEQARLLWTYKALLLKLSDEAPHSVMLDEKNSNTKTVCRRPDNVSFICTVVMVGREDAEHSL